MSSSGYYDKLAAAVGMSRAPGEDDDSLAERVVDKLQPHRHIFGTKADYAMLAVCCSRWVRYVEVEHDAARPGVVDVLVRWAPKIPGLRWIRVPLPSRELARVRATLRELAPVGTLVEVR